MAPTEVVFTFFHLTVFLFLVPLDFLKVKKSSILPSALKLILTINTA